MHVKINVLTITKTLVVSLLSVSLWACGTGLMQNVPPIDKPVVISVCQNPLIVGVDYDQSGSMSWSGTAALTTEDLNPLIEHIKNCGGEIGVTFVRRDSGKPLERLAVAEPPALPVEPTQNPNEEDYEFADRQDEYQKQLQARNDQILQFRKDLQPRIEDYLKGLEPLLDHKPKGGTDLWTSLNRLDVFLSEGNEPWMIKPHRYLLVLSDGADTMGKEKHAFKSGATVIWINAGASAKNLKDFPYHRVENFSQAVREILAKEQVK